MKKIIFAITLFSFVFCFPALAQQTNQVTLTTYYPAPFGMYQEMRVMGHLGVGSTYPGSPVYPTTKAKAYIQNNDASFATLVAVTGLAGTGNATNRSICLNCSEASGLASTGIGRSAVAQGDDSIALSGGVATGGPSLAVWRNSLAQGQYATAIGYGANAHDYNSFVVGAHNIPGVGSMTVPNSGDQIFAIGIGDNPSTPANAMTVLKNGNVGIGTTNPLAIVDVKDTFNYGTTVRDTINVFPNWQGAITANPTSLGAISWQLNSSNQYVRINAVRDSPSANTKAHLEFWTNNNLAMAERVRIANDGNVGIGTTNPGSNRLNVVGTVGNATSNFINVNAGGNRSIGLAVGTNRVGVHFQNNGVAHRGISSDGSSIFFGSASATQNPDNWGTDHVVITNTGSVGIGTSAPTQMLDVYALVRVRGQSSHQTGNMACYQLDGTLGHCDSTSTNPMGTCHCLP